MPLYEFHCERCDTVFEARQSMDEHAQVRPICPRCQSSERVQGSVAMFTPITSHKS